MIAVQTVALLDSNFHFCSSKFYFLGQPKLKLRFCFDKSSNDMFQHNTYLYIVRETAILFAALFVNMFANLFAILFATVFANLLATLFDISCYFNTVMCAIMRATLGKCDWLRYGYHLYIWMHLQAKKTHTGPMMCAFSDQLYFSELSREWDNNFPRIDNGLFNLFWLAVDIAKGFTFYSCKGSRHILC